MKPLLELDTSDTESKVLPRPKSADLACAAVSNYYEYSESEDITGRSCGYKKPKKMWLAKEQAQTECNPSDSPFYALDESGKHVSALLNLPQRPTSPVSRSSYSPSTGSGPGTAAVLSSSSTNTSSLSNHTPLVQGHGSGISSCATSPISLQEHAKKRRRSAKRDRSLKVSTLNSAAHPVSDESDFDSATPGSTLSSSGGGGGSAGPAGGGSGGLKIRIRRDLAATPAAKRCKGKGSGGMEKSTFRIVESWCDADAHPQPEAVRSKTSAVGSVSPRSNCSMSGLGGGLQVGDLVWAKLAGYPYWPARINAMFARTPQQLAQATAVEPGNEASLAILATPADASLAGGYTAKVDWMAWEQFSYISCAKLYPFLDCYDRLYNPRTRTKGYAEAVRMAQSLSQTSCERFCQSLAEHRVSPPSTEVVAAGATAELGAAPVDDLFPDFGFAPLPQLDVSGLGDFEANVPTFSEDEDDDYQAVTNQLKVAMNSSL